jgi:hypothetical protein
MKIEQQAAFLRWNRGLAGGARKWSSTLLVLLDVTQPWQFAVCAARAAG